MSDEPNTIRINDFAGFQASVNRLEELEAKIAKKIKAGEDLLEEVTAAASRGTFRSRATAASGTRVAPAYTETVSAVSTAVAAVDKQAASALLSLSTTIGDLKALRAVQQAIQEAGARKVAE